MGEEKATALLLMRKCIAYQHKTDKQPLLIKSVIVKEGIKGYIYVEAFKQPHVKAAIEDIGNLKMGLYKQEMVPIKEMPDVLRVIKDVVRLKQGSWVRLKRTMFKDDLAQVESVDTAQNQATLKLVPRIDYSRKRGLHKDHKEDEDSKSKRKRRPAQRLFDLDLIKSVGGLPTKERDSDYWIFEYNRYNQRGFLIKTFPLSAVITEGVKPTLAELQRFEDSPDGLDVDTAVTLGKTSIDKSHNFAPGDVVEVCQGELIHLNGVVVGIDGEKIRVMPKHEELKVKGKDSVI
jgi:transcription elongation factor SPT5